MAPRGRGGRRFTRGACHCRINRRNHRQRSRINPSDVVQTSRRRGVTIQTLRELNLFVKPVSKLINASVDWLSFLRDFGLLALKLFITLISANSKDGKSYPVGATQTILIGPDDLIAKHAFVEYEKDTRHAYIDYRLARPHQLFIQANAGSKLSERAGRYAMALVEMSLEEVEELKLPEGWIKPDSYSFQEILQMPGAKTAPFGTALRMNWRPSATSFARRTLSIGMSARGTSQKAIGGLPFIKVIVGYEDFASESGTVESMYNSRKQFLLNSASTSTTALLPNQGKCYRLVLCYSLVLYQ